MFHKLSRLCIALLFAACAALPVSIMLTLAGLLSVESGGFVFAMFIAHAGEFLLLMFVLGMLSAAFNCFSQARGE